ncbi:hypothetical protein AX16_008673 [Volvariella volvacea WC 439]|nr:hypothetical protein AX16_008673 [Volvariella volvacea WC 439]
MATLNSRNSNRRNNQYARNKLSRSNSSFLGTIKTIVTAPLSWFANTDDFDNEKDLGEKRRRLSPLDVVSRTLPDDNSRTRPKRIRVDSPPRTTYNSGYLDPPSALFKQQNPVPALTSRFAAINTRDGPSYEVTSEIPSNKALSPLRPALHTVALDHHIPTQNAPLDASHKASGAFTTLQKADRYSGVRELSMPPMSTRAPFRLRSSQTPQPQPARELSEPPALNTLSTKPVFVRSPPSGADTSSSLQSSSTLGSLLDTRRLVRSPSRSRSLVLGSVPSDIQEAGRQSPAERALHELDVYKTPLLPTRLRSNLLSTSGAGGPDLFKSRRKTQLVLMQETERREKLGKKQGKGKETVNETKPYAGEGGMRKLLARRRLEEVPQVVQESEAPPVAEKFEEVTQANNGGQEDGPQSPKKNESLEPASWHQAPPPGVSSLRIGRTKSSRQHITRPVSRPNRAKFSAAFEDDTDEVMDEPSKPVISKSSDIPLPTTFEPPKGFTFANTTRSLTFNSDDAKEPPILSLPFSLVPGSSIPPMPNANQPQAKPIAMSIEGDGRIETGSDEPLSGFDDSPSQPAKPGGIPNFFATSTAFNKPLAVSMPSASFSSIFPELSTQSTKHVAPPPSTPMPDGGNNATWLAAPLSNNVAGDVVKLPLQESATGIFHQSRHTITEHSEGTTASSQLSAGRSTTPASLNTPLSHFSFTRASISTPTTGLETSTSDKSMAIAIFGTEPKPLDRSSMLAPFPFSKSAESAFVKPMVARDMVNQGAMGDARKSADTTEAPVESRPSAVFPPIVSNSFTFNQTSSKSNVEGIPTAANTAEQKVTSSTTNTPQLSFEKPNDLGQSKKETPVLGIEVKPSSSPFAPNSSSFSFRPETESAIKPFSFSSPSIPPRPVTPPTVTDQEIRMDESPSRDMQINGTKGHDMSISFTPAPTEFNQQGPLSSSGSPFSFKTSTAFSNPFVSPATDDKASKTPSFSFPNQTPSFSFGSKPVEASPSTPFAFNAPTTPITPANTSTPFSFGTPTPSNLFVQTQTQAGSAPASPSALTPTPFAFGTSAAPINAPFTFGSSQPTSPAAPASPLSQNQSGFAGFGQPSTPTSPFNATAPSGGALFTIGAAPSPGTAQSPGGRQIRKLPTRRGGVKR